MTIPVAVGVSARVGQNTHLGLLLDRYVDSWEAGTGDFSEKVQKPHVQKVADLSRNAPPGFDWKDLFARHLAFLRGTAADHWDMVTAGPLTLHLARASALENTGICLHRVYGFAYLPGTVLKGLARAYAEQVWLPAQADQVHAGALLRRVFGCLKQNEDDQASAGAVVFHDAWPVGWPQLVADLVNSHHKGYYSGADAPGDWDQPNMVSFLAVKPGTAFRFALAKRRTDVEDELLTAARLWLTLALLDEGAGAKTAAGYGGFRLADKGAKEPERPAPTPKRARWAATLELVTPAFLAGANQTAEECDLRPATLRGLLRWWWRTMHAGYVDVATLRRLEADVWGNTKTGGAVGVTVEPMGTIVPLLFDKNQTVQQNRLPSPPNQQTTQGLVYVSYGMDETRHGQRRQRWHIAPGTKWTVRMTARPSQTLSAEMLLNQAKAALWLHCHLGGVGSKSRNGFGSFTDLAGMTFEQVRQAAADFRQAAHIGGPFQATNAESLSLEDIISPPADAKPWLEVSTPWANAWLALDQVGAAMQAFAQRYAHDPVKLALGLPRNIDGPRRDPMPHQGGRHKPPRPLQGPRGDRHAAPIFYHLTKAANGTYTIRVTAMIARSLPNEVDSRTLLTDLIVFLQSELVTRVGTYATAGTPAAVGSRSNSVSGAVTVTVLERREAGGKPTFKVQEEGRKPGMLMYGTPPAQLPEVGDTLQVYWNNTDSNNPQYRWDPPPPPASPPPRRPGPRRR